MSRIEKKNLTFALTNARSVWNKIKSLVDHIKELSASFVIVTETWYHAHKDMLLHEHGIQSIDRMRKKKATANPGGGVSIFFDTNKIKLTEYRTRRGDYEFVAARGKIPHNTRPLYIIGAYMPPKMTSENSRGCLNLLSETIAKIKTESTDPYIVLGGDFNNHDVYEAIGDYPDIKILGSGPTRNNEVRQVFNCAALTDEQGSRSDHRFIAYEAQLKHVHHFTWIKYKARLITDQGEAKLEKLMRETDWRKIEDLPTEERIARFHQVLHKITNQCFPLKQYKLKSTDKPWIDEAVCDMIDKRQRVFRSELRSTNWKKLKAKTNKMIKERKKKYYDRDTDKLSKEGSHRIAFKALKHIADADRITPWQLQALTPNQRCQK